MKRSSAVLLNVSALPSDFAIGTLGKGAKLFIDKISSMGFSYWQILPLTEIGAGDSPYSSPSAMAQNHLYIDPEIMATEGLLSSEDVKKAIHKECVYAVNYDTAEKEIILLLRKAFSELESKKEIISFFEKNSYIKEYSLYMALKTENHGKPWWNWGENSSFEKASANSSLNDEVLFWGFVQFEFKRQWELLHDYAKSKGVSIIGDMPIYVSLDSCDVWAHKNMFSIDPDTNKAKDVAGVPPDYFSVDGQLWGNPLYDWAEMENDNFNWWIDRIKSALNFCDMVRIDHFRAFSNYWAVPSTAKTAKEGEWRTCPGKELFDAVKKEIEKPAIIAEDLGNIDEEVVELLKYTDFPGMKVIQFGFDPEGDSTHLPHNYSKNSIAYVGTHDNNTLLGWLWEAKENERKFALDYCGFEGTNWGDGGYESPACRKIIEAVWRSPSDIAVISFQDLCGFGSDTRMNIPGQSEGNWCFRATEEHLNSLDSEYYKKINNVFKRK